MLATKSKSKVSPAANEAFENEKLFYKESSFSDSKEPQVTKLDENPEKSPEKHPEEKEIILPGRTLDIKDDLEQEQEAGVINIEDEDDEVTIESSSRLDYIKKMLNQTKVRVLNKDSKRPWSAPKKTKIKNLNDFQTKRPKTANANLFFDNKALEEEPEEEEESFDVNEEVLDEKIGEESFKEVAYIPYEYAEAMIIRICKDIDTIKSSHLNVIKQMEIKFKTFELKKQQYYRELIEKIKDSHKNRIEQYKQVISVLQVKQFSDPYHEVITRLELKNKSLEIEKQEILKKLSSVDSKELNKEKYDEEKEDEVKIREDNRESEKVVKDERSSVKDEDLRELQKDVIEEEEDLEDVSKIEENDDEDLFEEDEDKIESENEKSVDEDQDEIEDQEEANKDVKIKSTKMVSPEELRDTKALLLVSKKENREAKRRIKILEEQIQTPTTINSSVGVDRNQKILERKIKDLEKKLLTENKKSEKNLKNSSNFSAELKESKKEILILERRLKSQEEEVKKIQESAEFGAVALKQVPELKQKIKSLKSDNEELVSNYNSERLLRKKYYNLLEDMKGKIRVYCRVRPLSNTEKSNKNIYAVKSPDEYTIQIEDKRRNMKEFQFDQIFTNEHSQENVFEDTKMLIQSAVDGFNVCIFAYGQTGSGKTYTMIGDQNQTLPGIAPRAFERIFQLVKENEKKFEFRVSCYMLELYNDKLIDLLKTGKTEERLDIKKDKKEMVYIQGAIICEASDADELYKIFQGGSENRHIASTKMNSESSRSHLIIGIVIESINKTTGAVTKGKLSLVDLAGSERVAKTGAGAEQLKEANSINKSLSALGDVISALSTEQSFIPFRNNKLTMLMQDSLGGNSKTLMFVNISPADYNTDESIISLTYASRVKLITNNASKNADSKEVARLKQIIAKLKSGEDVDENE